MGNRRRHSEEFKREAVKLVTEGGYTTAEAARNLGIHENLLRVWRQKYGQATEGTAKVNESAEAELLRLREENRRLRMERDILKKATAFFANEKN